jgi:hypothetical protein
MKRWLSVSRIGAVGREMETGVGSFASAATQLHLASTCQQHTRAQQTLVVQIQQTDMYHQPKCSSISSRREMRERF